MILSLMSSFFRDTISNWQIPTTDSAGQSATARQSVVFESFVRQ